MMREGNQVSCLSNDRVAIGRVQDVRKETVLTFANMDHSLMRGIGGRGIKRNLQPVKNGTWLAFQSTASMISELWMAVVGVEVMLL